MSNSQWHSHNLIVWYARKRHVGIVYDTVLGSICNTLISFLVMDGGYQRPFGHHISIRILSMYVYPTSESLISNGFRIPPHVIRVYGCVEDVWCLSSSSVHYSVVLSTKYCSLFCLCILPLNMLKVDLNPSLKWVLQNRIREMYLTNYTTESYLESYSLQARWHKMWLLVFLLPKW